MKKNILKISAILGLCLVAFVGIAQAQKTSDDDDKKKKKSKIEKRIEVEQENGNTTVTITTIKDGKKTVEKLAGEEAEAFLKENAQVSGEGEDIQIRIEMDDSHSSSAKQRVSTESARSKTVEVSDINGEKVVKVVTTKDGEETVEEYRGKEAEEYLENQHQKMGHHGMQYQFDFSDMEGMDMDALQEKLEEMMSNMQGSSFSFDFDTEEGAGKGDIDVKVFMDGDNIPEDVKKQLEEMNINLEELLEEAGKGEVKRKVMVTTMVMVEDIENEDGEEALELDAFELFPNPSEGQLRIKFETGNEKQATVTVRDLNGKEVYKNQVKGSTNYELNVDLGEEASGTYIVTVDQGKKRKSKKLILK